MIPLLFLALAATQQTVSFQVPAEGNYRVTVTIGSPDAAAVTTVEAELRRLMVENVRTAPGQFEKRTFLVNVRRPQIAGAGEVRLKPREKESESAAWDDRLSLSWTGAVAGVDIEKADDVPTLYIAGDSTSTDQAREPFNSWGQMLTRFLKPEVAVANHGESGESLRSYIGEKRLDKVMSVIKPGDYLFIQMGHNDQKERGEGVGAFTTYKADLERFVRDARAKGATPVLVTPMHRMTFDADGKITNSLGDYPEAVRRVAREQNVPLIDLNAMSKSLYEAVGPANAPRLFAKGDTTHHSDYGSYELAKCVVEGIRASGLPLGAMIAAGPVFNPAHPDPAPRLPHVFVIGDSTASNGPERGWGSHLGKTLDGTQEVVNWARAGRSSRTFRTEGLWDKVRVELQPGDTVLIQFGHNDGGPPDKDRARGSLAGLGEESKEFTLPDGKKEIVYTFGWYMRRYIEETRAKGATPIVLSPTVRNIWKGTAVERGPGRYAEWSATVARDTGAKFLPVTDAIADRYEDLGPDAVKRFFPEDHTHTNPEGAALTASIVAETMTGKYPPEIPEGRLKLTRPRDPKLATIFLIGDSTVRNGYGDGANGQWGWGEPLVDRFDAAQWNITNRAVGGLSSRTYLTQGHWAHVLTMLKPGDYVVMQFGHNDNGPLDDTARARGTIAGIGDETREIDNPITKKHEIVHTYGWYLRRFIGDARAKGAIPIVCSPIPRKTWKDGKIVRPTTYPKWAQEVAATEGTPFIDLHELIATRYDAMGEKAVDPLFADEHTHTSRAGAEINADIVSEALRPLIRN